MRGLVVLVSMYFGMHEILTSVHFFALIISVYCHANPTYADTKSRKRILFFAGERSSTKFKKSLAVAYPKLMRIYIHFVLL